MTKKMKHIQQTKKHIYNSIEMKGDLNFGTFRPIRSISIPSNCQHTIVTERDERGKALKYEVEKWN